MSTATPDLGIRPSDPATQDDTPIHSHIVDRGDDTRSVHVILMEARVNGTPVTAICGHVWVPSRNPENHPLCSRCEEIFPFVRDMRGK